MVFLYVFVLGYIMSTIMSGYELVDVINIFSRGNSVCYNANMYEVATSFTFYYISISHIVKSIEKMAMFYDYIYVRTKSKSVFFLKMIKSLTFNVIIIAVQKMVAEVLLMVVLHKNCFTIEYILQNIICMTTLLMLGVVGITFFYCNCFSYKIVGSFSLTILIFIILSIREIDCKNVLIPINLTTKSIPKLGLVIKTVIICTILIYARHKSKLFERIKCND